MRKPLVTLGISKLGQESSYGPTTVCMCFCIFLWECVCVCGYVCMCVCVMICVLQVSVRVLPPFLWFKRSLGCHYGIITVSVWLMARSRALIVHSLYHSSSATTPPSILLSGLCSAMTISEWQHLPHWIWRLYLQLVCTPFPAGSIKGPIWCRGRLVVKNSQGHFM